MRILFIGGGGNISAACAGLLRRRGHEVAVVGRGHNAAPEGCALHLGERRDAGFLAKVRGEFSPEVVVNFLGFSPADLEVDLTVFGGAVEQYIFISSATVYRKPHRLPVTEEDELGNQWSEYARNKLACEEWLAAHRQRLPYTIVRPSHTYSSTWVPNLISSADYTFADRLTAGKPVFVPDDGQTLWTLTTSDDFAPGLAGLAGKSAALGEAFHITSDEALTWRQIYREAAAAFGAANPVIENIPVDFACGVEPSLVGKLKGDKAHHAVFDNAKIKSFVPDFQCVGSVRRGMRESAAWFANNPERQVPDPKIDQIWDNVTTAWSKQS